MTFARFLVCLGLGLELLGTITGIAAADESPDAQPTPASDRTPTFVRRAPAGALLVQLEPPSVGEQVLGDPLTEAGPSGDRAQCVTGKNVRDFVGEGTIIKVTGPCLSEFRFSRMDTPLIPGLDIPDGDVHVEFKVASGYERAILGITTRAALDNGCTRGYTAIVATVGIAGLIQAQGCSGSATLASRSDLAGKVRRDDWNTLALRAEGPNMWLFLNDELVVSVADATYDHGSLNLLVARSGDVNSPDESAVVFRNLRVSALLPRGGGEAPEGPQP